MNIIYDVIIVGGGPAGLAAAIYLARAKYRILVIEKEKFGGQITITSEIVNYPGIERTSGTKLTDTMRFQAEDFGAEFVLAKVTELVLDQDIKYVRTDRGKEYHALGIVLALGASPRKIGFLGEKEFQGRGVAYCATCDGEFFTDREVLVAGGGFAAVEEAIFLTKYARKVTILVRKNTFSCAAGVVEQLKHYPDIEVRFRTEILEVGGDGVITWARLKNNESGAEGIYKSDDGGPLGVFVFAGYEPATALVRDKVLLNEQGYIVTDADQKTSLEGVYAAGDVCIKKLRQVVTAVADGAVAATSLEKYVTESREHLNLPKEEIKAAAVSSKEKLQMTNQAEKDKTSDGFISEEMKEQLAGIFGKFEKKVFVAAVLGKDSAAGEISGFAKELKGIHRNVEILVESLEVSESDRTSYLDIRTEKGSVGIRYYSVPGGHEFNSFVIALYNAAGPGQQISEAVSGQIAELRNNHLLQVMTTLSCTNCPEVVMGTQKIASMSPKVEAEMYDIAKFPQMKEKLRIMAVPCLVVDKEKVFFGKRSLEDILRLLE